MVANVLLGAVPSRLDLTHPDSLVVFRAGYEITDFGSLFGTPEEGFLVTTARGNVMIVRDIVVESLGPLALSTGEMMLFDPSDASVERTAIAVAESLPPGEHEIWIARSGTEVLGALLVFAGETPVTTYRPARLGAADAPVPVPPRFFMPPTRLAIGMADRAAYLDVLASSKRDMPWTTERALRLAFAPGEDIPEQPPEGWVAKQTTVTPPLFEPLRDLAQPHPRVVAAPGIVGFTCDTQATTWLGLDSAKQPRVLALDFSRLRRWGGAVSQPGISLAKIPLAISYLLAGFEALEAAELALSFRDRVEAYDRGGTFEPDERESKILA